MGNVKIVSYYTEGTPYKEVMERHLLPSLDLHGLDHHIGEVPDLGGWLANTQHKLAFLLEMLDTFPGHALVWLDADAEVLRHPSLLYEMEDHIDFAAHWMDWGLQWRGRENGRVEMLGGTMYLKNNQAVRNALGQAVALCGEDPELWEQRALQTVVAHQPDFSIYLLPASYCTVVLRDGTVPPRVRAPVILHHQASRKHRKKDER
jgi:hypothetical protein